MLIQEFSELVCERIGYYVYALTDPRTNTIFYIGKGQGNRVFQHVRNAQETTTSTDKYDVIREIISSGHHVQHTIVRHGLTEELAFEIESVLIEMLGMDQLTNEVQGHNYLERGMKSIDEIVQFYDSKPAIFDEKCMIIIINSLYKRGMSDNELYEATRTGWKVGPKREKAQYAVAAYRGFVREVYEIQSWKKRGQRWDFVGKVAEEAIRKKYLHCSLENYIKKGSRNPILYTFQETEL